MHFSQNATWIHHLIYQTSKGAHQISAHLQYSKSVTKLLTKLQFIEMKNIQIVLLIVVITVCFAVAQRPFSEDYTRQDSARNDGK